MVKRFVFFRFLVAGVAVLVLLIVYYIKDSRIPGFFPACPFHNLTGLFCPGCGTQRSLSALLHFNFLQALHYNVLFVLGLPVLAYFAYIGVTDSTNKSKPPSLLNSPVFVKMSIAIVIVFAVLRNIPVYPFTLIAP